MFVGIVIYTDILVIYIYIYIYSKEFVIVDILKGGTIVMKLGKEYNSQTKK